MSKMFLSFLITEPGPVLQKVPDEVGPRNIWQNVNRSDADNSTFSLLILHVNKNNNITNTLFTVVERLINPSASVSSELLSTKSYNDFASFHRQHSED